MVAGQYAEAAAVVAHGLSQIAATDTAGRSAYLDSVIQYYTESPPYQFHAVKMYLDTLERLGAAYRPWNLYRNYFWLMHTAYIQGEDSLAMRAGNRMFDLAPAASKGAKADELSAVGVGLLWALRITRGTELLDSLRQGTAAYGALMVANFRRALGFVPQERVWNTEAPVLQGDYWFPRTAAGQEYPRRGKISMVVFTPDRGQNLVELNMLRRLSQKYPAVDLVLVTSTAGNYGPLEPPSPEREAFLSDSTFRHFHRLNAVLSVTKGTFVQLDVPDSRRFYQIYPNEEAYPPRNSAISGTKLSQIYLIDGERRIVDVSGMTVIDEGWTGRLIETLLARTAEGSRQ
jgi:hypothetical protein